MVSRCSWAATRASPSSERLMRMITNRGRVLGAASAALLVVAVATVSFSFGEAKTVKTLEEIEVRAEKRIDVKSSQTTHTIDAAQLKALPVDNIRDAVATKAGVVAQGGELHFRGGRGNEVKFQFD